MWQNDPSWVRHPLPLGHESPQITTRPWLPFWQFFSSIFLKINQLLWIFTASHPWCFCLHHIVRSCDWYYKTMIKRFNTFIFSFPETEIWGDQHSFGICFHIRILKAFLIPHFWYQTLKFGVNSIQNLLDSGGGQVVGWRARLLLHRSKFESRWSLQF